MSHLLDRLNFLQSKELGRFANGHGQLTRENRDWEDTYRNRWRHDKIVRSTHGVNCTGSCSWKIYVKSGIVTWETQQTDYPRTRPDLPNHEPRGCARGASAGRGLSGGRICAAHHLLHAGHMPVEGGRGDRLGSQGQGDDTHQNHHQVGSEQLAMQAGP